jgi:peroxiredoxin
MFEARGNDLSQQNADGTWTLPISATYVVDRTGRLVAGHAYADWRVRMDPTEIIAALSALSR